MSEKSQSLSRDIVVRATVTVSIILLFTAGLSYWLSSRQLAQSFDATLLAKAQLLVTQVKEYSDEVEFDFADEFMPEYEREIDPEYYQIWQDNTGVFERSNSLKGRDLPLLQDTENDIYIGDIQLPDQRKGRVVQIYFLPQLQEKSDRTPARIAQQKRMHLVIARERRSLDSQLLSVASIIFFMVFSVIVVIAVLIHLSVKRGLVPLSSLQVALSRTNIDNLDEEVDIGEPPIELEALVDQLNGMARRISESVRRERRFSADVAHELKTPIAELLNLAEVSLRWPDKVTDHSAWYQDVMDSSTTMQNIVEKLLKLSRCENGQIVLEPVELKISEVLAGVQRRVRRLCDQSGVTIKVELDDDFSFHCSHLEVELIFQNLLTNAIEYSPPNNVVVVKTWTSDNEGHVAICNTAPNLCPDDLAVMFDRLWRKDEARGGHLNSGLGLPLVAAYAQILGLKVDTSLDDASIFTVQVSNLRVI